VACAVRINPWTIQKQPAISTSCTTTPVNAIQIGSNGQQFGSTFGSQ